MSTTKGKAFAGGLWVIPLLTGLACLWSAYRGIRSSQSGSTTQTPSGTIDTGNVSFFETGGGIFSIIFLLATIGIIIWMNREK